MYYPNRRTLILSSSLIFLKPVFAMPKETLAAINAFTGGKPYKEGFVTIEMNELVDNGNSVSIRVKVDHPQIKRIALFNEKNPQADIAIFTLHGQKAEVATRIRLATTQVIHALAESASGEFYHASAEPIVTLAACLEE
jgi:sulfur-oxidizing protein SoxY